MSELQVWVVAVLLLALALTKKKLLSMLGRVGRKRGKRLRGLMKTGRGGGGEEAGRDVCRELSGGKE